MVAALTLIFSVMTSYARARAESLVEKCKVGFMERPERIVLFMIGAFTNRMAGVLWVILVLSILAVANRIYYTYLALNGLVMPSREGPRGWFTASFSGPTSARRCPTTSGWSRFWRSCGSHPPAGSAIPPQGPWADWHPSGLGSRSNPKAIEADAT